MNFKITVSYDGTKYNGWQKQGNTDNTIQAKFETLLSKIFSESIEINASGRTDAGVHAKGQICNFKVSEKQIKIFLEKQKLTTNYQNDKLDNNSLHTILLTINSFLPQDIRVLSIENADLRFHARLLATGKHYSYSIDNGEVANIFNRKYLTRIENHLDIQAIKQATSYFIGTHDFRSFCTKANPKKSTIRTISKIEITENNSIIRFDFYGDGFLYNMIRLIMRVLIDIGLHKRESSEIQSIFETKNKSAVGFPAPAEGLCLEEVYY